MCLSPAALCISLDPCFSLCIKINIAYFLFHSLPPRKKRRGGGVGRTRKTVSSSSRTAAVAPSLFPRPALWLPVRLSCSGPLHRVRQNLPFCIGCCISRGTALLREHANVLFNIWRSQGWGNKLPFPPSDGGPTLSQISPGRRSITWPVAIQITSFHKSREDNRKEDAVAVTSPDRTSS